MIINLKSYNSFHGELIYITISIGELKDSNKLLSTLYFIDKEDNEKIGSCEIVIVKNQEEASEELSNCIKNIEYFENILKDKKNLNILTENITINNLI
jgi:hypothetical protein